MRHHQNCQHKIYRLSCLDYERLWERSDGRCEICGTPESETVRGLLCIDHDHRYDASVVRGLVCDKCNAGMAQVDAAKRSPTRSEIRYLKNAWFLVAELHWKGVPALYDGRPEADVWAKFGRVTRDRKALMRHLILWYLRTPGVRMVRPPAAKNKDDPTC